MNFLKPLPICPNDVWYLICPHRPELSEALDADFSDPYKLNGNTWAELKTRERVSPCCPLVLPLCQPMIND